MKKTIFLNQDTLYVLQGGTIVYSPGVFQYLGRITEELDFQPVVVFNNPTKDSWEVVEAVFKQQEISFKDGIFSAELLSPSSPFASPLLKNEVSLPGAVFVSNQQSDLNWATERNWQAIKFEQPSTTLPGLTAWKNIYTELNTRPRVAAVSRVTSETTIEVEINLDGSGKSNIHTGLGFFDHQLDQIARHGNMDLSITVEGDLHIDEHHTIEDVGLVLGECFLKALGNKKGIARYGFLLPMDDCLAQVAVDFGGRPWLVWDATFQREKIGDMPTEMFSHFFKSFSDTSKSNLNITAQGDNEHHKIESIFKAFAKALNMAKQKTGDNNIPSTKGAL